MKRALIRAPLGPKAALALASAALELEALLDREETTSLLGQGLAHDTGNACEGGRG